MTSASDNFAGAAACRPWTSGRVALFALLALALCSVPPSFASELAADHTDELEADQADALGDDFEDFDDEYDEYDDEYGFADDTEEGFPDPFETPNRLTLKVNQTIDTFILDPITQLYRLFLPEFARRSISRFFDNVNSPQVLVNDMLQLEWKDAGVTTARLLVNSTIGIGGLFDPAADLGLPGHLSDFGQTLAIAGATSGPYFVIPLLGPSNVRDGIGLGVDAFLQPTFFLLPGTTLLMFGGSAGLSERAKHFEELKALEDSSIDYYAALRNGYYQNRISEIWSRREDRRPQPAEPPAEPAAPPGDAATSPDVLAASP